MLPRVSAAEATRGLEAEASPSWEPELRPGPGCPLAASRPETFPRLPSSQEEGPVPRSGVFWRRNHAPVTFVRCCRRDHSALVLVSVGELSARPSSRIKLHPKCVLSCCRVWCCPQFQARARARVSPGGWGCWADARVLLCAFLCSTCVLF